MVVVKVVMVVVVVVVDMVVIVHKDQATVILVVQIVPLVTGALVQEVQTVHQEVMGDLVQTLLHSQVEGAALVGLD